ncbi:hypothetical protein FOMPIDRAFT_53849 [Fomitopsis schrenkii]|uniref:DUF6589 domain-containing protein n=1 Tax=Fomitopsis schrenkii TaxID=2126942 RepID=S8ECN3_FOMSC|nr:hypothetical protein FOMPIDRAFT_53849 [Fomitopsis schrenkii]
MKTHYHRAARALTDKEHGWHLGAVHMKASQVLDFRIKDMALRMRESAPELWDLIVFLLSGDEQWSDPFQGELLLSDEELALWGELGDELPASSDSTERASQSKQLRQSLCRQCNALAAVNGIFLHACNTPDKIVKALAHMGISISPSSINNAIRSLSIESANTVRELGQSREAMYAYDNLEVTLNTTTPTFEQSTDRLIHLTSGMIMRMGHGVKASDLRCSDVVWQMSLVNPRIPVTKLEYHPLPCMEINQSKVDGNIQAISELFRCAGVGDPEAKGAAADTVDISKYVTLIHGDLGTGERVQAIQKRRSIERTALLRFQPVIFSPGILHAEMACVDTIWRIFIQPPESRLDDNSLMKFVGKLRPRETGQIGSKPKFCQMHEVILHSGIVLRLDCWRTEARSRFHTKGVKTLEDFAAQQPTLEQLVAMSYGMVSKYSAGKSNLFALRRQKATTRDQQYENMTLMHQYFSLYEELYWRANAGDVGGLEVNMRSWIAMFKATGKHKYAAHLLRFLCDVHFVYPERLRRAVRLNWLVNPTGKPHAFRGVDWLVELMNLFTKHTYGGDGSNFTKDRIITESPIVHVYQSCVRNAERNFDLSRLTSAHGKKDMGRTYAALLNDLDETAPHERREGRKSAHCIQNMIDKGIGLLLAGIADEGAPVDMTHILDGLDSTLDLADMSVFDDL